IANPSSPQSIPAPKPSPVLPTPSSSPASSPPPALPAPPKSLATVPIRIGITNATTQAQVSSSTAAVIMDAQGNQISTLPAQTSTVISPGTSNLNVGNLSFPNEIWIKPSSEGLVAVNGRWYRGSIQIVLDRQRLVTVNHLDLESYLYSVVGAEMSASWPIEAHKAQAIAARSYALARLSSNRASPYYDLGDTPRWQAYRGVETEANTTHQAVNGTQGLLVSYQGGVVETLYASTEHLVSTVHKGYGMSQNSARDLAYNQLNYQQILNHFYPGTTLAWLQAS
ncbi:MAG: SpoIID/LytB domain-containing protein, partial [Thermosynechococcaceae cyanobacterium]